MSDDGEFSLAETVGEADDIRTGPIKIVGGYAFRLVAEIVATLSRNNDPETGRRKSADVVAPAVPELRLWSRYSRSPPVEPASAMRRLIPLVATREKLGTWTRERRAPQASINLHTRSRQRTQFKTGGQRRHGQRLA